MKRRSQFKILVIIAIANILSCCHPQENEIRQAVKEQLARYPASSLQDIYKSFFQDEFGPGHLIEDTVGAREYLEYELNEMTSRGNYIAEPCGTGKNFYRVPLDLVKDGKIPFDMFLNAFLESAHAFRVPKTTVWKSKWEGIVRVIESMDLRINHFEEDKTAISRMLDSGETVVHHSQPFVDKYDPHYRIIGKKRWEMLKAAVITQ